MSDVTGILATVARKRPALSFLVAWAALVALIAPYGEFSLNDDWAYTFSIKEFLETGDIRLTFWSAMTLIGQLALGALWASVFGSSEFSFRMLTAILAGGSLVAFYKLVRAGGGAHAAAFAATTALLAFPIFQASALTFMTDAPHLAACLGAALAFSLALTRERWAAPFACALGLMIVALLIRQTAIALALAFLVADFVAHGPTRRTFARSAIVAATAVAVLAVYGPVMKGAGLLPEAYGLRYAEMKALGAAALRFDIDAFAPMAVALVQGARIFGVMVAPIVLFLVLDRRSKGMSARYWILGGVISCALFAAAAAVDFRLARMAASLLSPDGVGPRPLEPQSINLPPTLFIICISAIGSAAFGFLVAEINRRRDEIYVRFNQSRQKAAVIVMTAIVAVASFAPYGLTTLVFFDRYVLLPGAFAIAALAMATPSIGSVMQGRRALFVSVFGASALGAAVLVHDYFAWNRARAEIIADFQASKGVDGALIDGGFEHNMRLLLERRPEDSMTLTFEDAGALRRPYVVSKRRYARHHMLANRSVGQIAPLDGDRLYILRRPSDAPQLALER